MSIDPIDRLTLACADVAGDSVHFTRLTDSQRVAVTAIEDGAHVVVVHLDTDSQALLRDWLAAVTSWATEERIAAVIRAACADHEVCADLPAVCFDKHVVHEMGRTGGVIDCVEADVDGLARLIAAALRAGGGPGSTSPEPGPRVELGGVDVTEFVKPGELNPDASPRRRHVCDATDDTPGCPVAGPTKGSTE